MKIAASSGFGTWSWKEKRPGKNWHESGSVLSRPRPSLKICHVSISERWIPRSNSNHPPSPRDSIRPDSISFGIYSLGNAITKLVIEKRVSAPIRGLLSFHHHVQASVLVVVSRRSRRASWKNKTFARAGCVFRLSGLSRATRFAFARWAKRRVKREARRRRERLDLNNDDEDTTLPLAWRYPSIAAVDPTFVDEAAVERRFPHRSPFHLGTR